MADPFQVPNVFVVPPEEDETPVWCCFDAALPLEQQIAQGQPLEMEIQIFDPTIDYDDEFAAMDTATMARRNMETRSIVETLMARNYNIDHTALDSDSDLDWDSENEDQSPHPHSLPQHPISPRTESDAGNDSDVIEVVKVSRSKRGTDTPPPLGMKRSATFKARATKAFRSFTGTFRSSKSQTRDALPPRPSSSMSCDLRREDNMDKSRPGSRVSHRFSQLFTSSSVRSRISLASSDEPSSPTVALSSHPAMSSSARRPSVSYADAPHPRRSSIYQESIPDTLSRAASPNPPTSGKSTIKRFSKLNLQKMFSFSSSNPVNDPTPHSGVVSGRSTPTLKRKSSSLPSTCSESSGPQTPTSTEGPLAAKRSTVLYDEEGRSPQLDFETGFPLSQGPTYKMHPSSSAGTFSSFASTASSSYNLLSKGQPGTILEDGGDVSFEMRLDSLHFDSLSFDADRFLFD